MDGLQPNVRQVERPSSVDSTPDGIPSRTDINERGNGACDSLQVFEEIPSKTEIHERENIGSHSSSDKLQEEIPPRTEINERENGGSHNVNENIQEEISSRTEIHVRENGGSHSSSDTLQEEIPPRTEIRERENGGSHSSSDTLQEEIPPRTEIHVRENGGSHSASDKLQEEIPPRTEINERENGGSHNVSENIQEEISSRTEIHERENGGSHRASDKLQEEIPPRTEINERENGGSHNVSENIQEEISSRTEIHVRENGGSHSASDKLQEEIPPRTEINERENGGSHNVSENIQEEISSRTEIHVRENGGSHSASDTLQEEISPRTDIHERENGGSHNANDNLPEEILPGTEIHERENCGSHRASDYPGERRTDEMVVATSVLAAEQTDEEEANMNQMMEEELATTRIGAGLTDIIVQDQTEHAFGSQCPGTMDQGALAILLRETESVFIETSIFNKVKDSLKRKHHVTICGASGEGKTSTALVLGEKYRARGYQLLLVNDIDKFRLNLDPEKKLLIIFDDIFGTVGLSTDVPHLKSILHDMQLFLRNGKITHHVNDKKCVIGRLKLYVIFTTKTYNLECAMSKLEGNEFYFFKGPTVFDMTRLESYRYTITERKHIFEKHKEVNNFSGSIDVDDICNTENNMFGFPLTCSLFYKFHSFQKNFETFFKSPLFYLKTELNRILGLMNEQSASLILMLLCDDCLNLHQVELESDNEMLESRLKTMQSIVGSVTRTDIARAARHFRGTFFTEGDVIGFSHPTIYDACACALYGINPSFVLQNCSIKFLYERVQPQPVQFTAVNDHLHIIYVSEAYYDVIATRLAEAVDKGNYSMSISHPILQVETVVDKVFEILELRKTNMFDNLVGNRKAKRLTVLHNTNDGKYLLQWAVLAKSIYLVKKILTIGNKFSKYEIIESFYTCSSCGNVDVMGHFLQVYKSIISPTHITEALNVAVENHHNGLVFLLIQRADALRTLSIQRQKMLFHNYAEEENKTLCELLLTEVFGNRVVDAFRRNPPADFRNICNDLLQFACRQGNLNLAEFVVKHGDINSQGQHDCTPVMYAAISGQKVVFDLLVTNGADLTLTRNDGDTVLHRACRGGNTSIVKHLLPLFDINSRGQYDWTPVMNAADSGQKEVFDLLVTNGADLTLTDNDGATVLQRACRGGNTSIVKHLLLLFDINSRGQYDWTPVINAADSGQKEVFDLLVTNGADLTLTGNQGATVLHRACRGGNTSIVKHLLPFFNINSRGQHGCTPVMYAADSGQKKVFDLLVTNGADLTLTDINGDTVLHMACREGNTSIVKHLLPLFDINSRGQYDWTPLSNAADSGQKEVFDLLVTNGADLTLTDSDGDTVLHRACRGGNTSIVKHLLPLFDINSRGQHGWTPIMYAADSGQKEVFDLLVTNGADLTLTDNDVDNILHRACRGGNTSIVKHILPLFDINSRGQHGCTPVINAADSGQKEVFDLLVTNGADLTLAYNDGATVLHGACRGGNTSIVKHLLPLFDINSRGQYDWTPVINAADSGQKEVFDLLVTNGADLTLTGNQNATVLHRACRGGNTSIVKHLLPLFDINSRGQHGWTPIMYAADSGQKEVFDLLVTNGADLTLTDNDGATVLHTVFRVENASIVF